MGRERAGEREDSRVGMNSPCFHRLTHGPCKSIRFCSHLSAAQKKTCDLEKASKQTNVTSL